MIYIKLNYKLHIVQKFKGLSLKEEGFFYLHQCMSGLKRYDAQPVIWYIFSIWSNLFKNNYNTNKPVHCLALWIKLFFCPLKLLCTICTSAKSFWLQNTKADEVIGLVRVSPPYCFLQEHVRVTPSNRIITTVQRLRSRYITPRKGTRRHSDVINK